MDNTGDADQWTARAAVRSLSSAIVLRGTVVPGDKRGRVIGFPTANLHLDSEMLPKFGVYAGRLDGMPAAISVGVRPTFGVGLQPILEAYVIGFTGDLYGREVTVTLTERIREELTFDTVDQLVAQIRQDVAVITMVLSSGA